MTSVESDIRELQHHIDGTFTGAAGGGTFDDLNPFTGEIVARAAAGGREDARRAVEAAAAAFPAWSKTPPAERQRVFLKAADLLEARAEEVAGWLTRETGSAFGFSMFQLHFVPGLFRQAAALAYAPLGEVLPSDYRLLLHGPEATRRRRRRDRAVERGAHPLCPRDRRAARTRQHGRPEAVRALALLGRSRLGARSSRRPACPRASLNVVTHAPGEAAAIGDELVENPHVRRLNFTGSTATGRRLAEAAGRQLKRIVLELGGQNPLIVLGDADVEYAVNATAFGAFMHQGQICMSTRRVLVERSIAEEFTEKLAAKTRSLKTGDPGEHDTVIGPLIDGGALEVVRSRVEAAVAGGARVLAGGEAVGPCFQATLLTDVPPDSDLANHETFGPVATIEIVDDAEAAVARANATSYGLSSGIITSDADRGLALAQQIDSGIVHVNDQTVSDEPQMPFGGVKDSGFGRFGGSAVIDEFTELRWVTVQSGSHPFPF